MAVHAHAVSDAVLEKLVIGTVAGVDNDFARGGIHRPTFRSGLGGGECGTLRAMHDIENLPHLVAGFAEHKSPRDIGSVALHLAASIH